LIFEFGTGFVLAKGTFDLWSKRKGSSQDFNGAKNTALMGCGLGMITWFGLFAVIGGVAYQMWQTQIGDGSFDAAFQFTLTYGVLFLIVNGDDS
jgi:predicted small integral membrane protein